MAKESQSPEEPRIGVFVCHCGTNIGGYVDVPAVIEYVKILPYVAYAERNLYTCADDGLTSIKNAIKEHNLNRVVVASCTPRTHAPLFKATCEDAGLNKYLFEFANIRDQCSWVHMHEPERATQKAKDLIRMAVAKAVLLEPQKEPEIQVTPSSLIVGGGISGMTAALNLANRGFQVHLVEKERVLGGYLNLLNKLYQTEREAAQSTMPLVKDVSKHKRIKLFVESTVKSVEGFIGNYDVGISTKDGDQRIKVGTIIVATGAVEYKPTGLFGYGQCDNVVTQTEFEELVKNSKLKKVDDIVFIQCAGSRWQKYSYCSRICCSISLKNAIHVKELYPKASVTILHRGISSYGVEHEAMFTRAREKGVRFIRYSLENLPTVGIKDNKLNVSFYHDLLKRTREQKADYVVLAAPIVQRPEAEELSKILKVPLGQDRFFFEAHVKLRPVDFATDGIFLCGTARAPVDATEAVAQAYGAAMHASIPMTAGKVKAEAIFSVVNRDLCIGCGSCVPACAYSAISMKHVDGKLVSESNPMLCKGCGTCAAVCPAHAITMQCFTDRQIIVQISEALATPFPNDEPKIVGFCCNWCSYAGADMAGVSRFQYPPNIRIIRTMCSGRVYPNFVLWAFLNGADGVFVSGCHPADCHYVSGNRYAEERIKRLKELMAAGGLDPRRLRLEWISASEGQRFADIVKNFTEQIRSLGPNKMGGMRNV